MPFPANSSLRVVGPAMAVVLVCGSGVTDPPLQILNSDEVGVAEVTQEGRWRMIEGQFVHRGPSIIDSVPVPL